MSPLLQVFVVALQLGLTSFGGPVAHLGYFHREYVERRRWVTPAEFADLTALAQALPGPASSQVGMAIGYLRAGIGGAIAAWLGFTLPSALLLVSFAAAVRQTDLTQSGWLHGLQLVAVAVVAAAVTSMWRQLAAGWRRSAVAVGAALLTLLWPRAWTQVAIIGAAACLGACWPELSGQHGAAAVSVQVPARRSRSQAGLCFALFALLLIALPVARASSEEPLIAVAESFFRAGSLVFGGGHVVLPLLEQETVAPGWISQSDFVTGYGAAQAVPGPLFTFAAYLGLASFGVAGAAVALSAIFLPSFLLMLGALPVWHTVRSRPFVARALTGVQAAVVGLLLAALYDPLWRTAVTGLAAAATAAGLYALLTLWRLPPVVIVLVGALLGALLQNV